ncbi:MAG: hypothetical protein M3N54_01365 [Acidobacteriota bacterium]|nr:hypothetical protein [Acidobacteriota bacterium]
MAGYLDQYGAGVDRRNKVIARIVSNTLIAIVVFGLGWYLLKNHHQEGVVKDFVAAVRKGDLAGAYRIWGCTHEKPCSAYEFDKFSSDWGPGGDAPDPALFGLTDSESCNQAVLLTVQVNKSRVEKLWVAKGDDTISFAPYPVCPHKNPFAIMLHRTIGKLRKPLLK